MHTLRQYLLTLSDPEGLLRLGMPVTARLLNQ